MNNSQFDNWCNFALLKQFDSSWSSQMCISVIHSLHKKSYIDSILWPKTKRTLDSAQCRHNFQYKKECIKIIKIFSAFHVFQAEKSKIVICYQ